jgi:hypothetical protein
MEDSVMEDTVFDDYGDSDAFSPVAPVVRLLEIMLDLMLCVYFFIVTYIDY